MGHVLFLSVHPQRADTLSVDPIYILRFRNGWQKEDVAAEVTTRDPVSGFLWPRIPAASYSKSVQ